MFSNSKKGQSLVEVMVAMSIVILVMTSSLTLVITVINAAANTRVITEATSLAQKGLAEGYYKTSCGCDGINLSSVAPGGFGLGTSINIYGPSNPLPPTPPDGLSLSVDLYQIPDAESSLPIPGQSETDSDLGMNGANFYRLVSKVSWRDRNGNIQDYSLAKIVPIGNNTNE